MNNSLKRVLAALLCVAMLLPMIPLQSVFAADEVTPEVLEIQAEDTQYTNVYKYNDIGSTHVGGANEVVKDSWPTYDQLVSRDYFDKSNVPYIAFYVEAPEDGKYSMAVAYNYGSAADMQHFAALVVNGGGEGNVYKTLRSDSGTSGNDATTEAVDVTLKKGVNTVYCIVMTKDQFNGNSGWANVEKFVLDGRLTAVKNNAVTLQATNATYLNKWNPTDGYVNGADSSVAASEKLSIADLTTPENLAKVPFAAYTVYAEKDGYYDITVDVAAGTLAQDPDAVGMIVDGVPYAKKFQRHSDCDGVNWATRNAHYADVSVWLEAGVHTLAVTMLMPVDAEDAQSFNYCWTDMSAITLHGGLVRADIQIDPLTGKQSVEAENTDYVLSNKYTAKTTPNRNFFDYGQLADDEPDDNQTLEDIKANGLNLENNAMATMFVYAPADGTYSIGVRGAVKISGLWSDSAWTTQPYYTIVVNEKDVYQANVITNNEWVADSAAIEVTLKKGVNAISCVPLVKELQSGSYWADLDCLYADSKLTILSGMDFDSYEFTRIEAEDKTVAIWNRYGSDGSDTCTNDVGNGWNGYNQSVEEMEAWLDEANTAYIAFYVNAPEDGEYYIMGNGYLQIDSNWENGAWKTTPYAAFVVNDQKVYTSEYDGTNGSTQDTKPVKVTLKKGVNTIKFVPRPNDENLNSNDGWFNVDCLKIDGRLEAVSAAPLTLDPSEGKFYQYNDNGTSLGGCNKSWISENKMTADSVKAADLENIPSTSFTVTAPADGYYDVMLKFNGQLSGFESAAFALLVDGEVHVVEFDYDDGQKNTEYNSGIGRYNVSVWLSAGDHVLSFTMQLPKNAASVESAGYGWTDMNSIILGGGLKLAAEQKDPTDPTGSEGGEEDSDTPDLSKIYTIEAEDTEYAKWNLYKETESNGGANNGGLLVGNADATNNVSLEALQADPNLDLSSTAYISYVVEAPKNGKYVILPRYLIRDADLDDGAAIEDGKRPYCVVVVNGKVYTAQFGGNNGWVYNTDLLTEVEMVAGQNTIYVIPLIKEVQEMGYDWANMDCLFVEGRLTPVKLSDVKTEDDVYDESTMKVVEAETDGYWNRYGNQDGVEAAGSPEGSSSASGGYVVGGAWQVYNQTVAELKANGLDSSNTAYIGFYVEAPQDGEYYIKASAYVNTNSDWSAFTPYGAFVVNGTDVYTGTYTGTNADFNDTELVKVSLKKGVNSIAFVPRPDDDALDSNSGWANVDCLKIDSALTGVSAATLKLDPSEGIYYQYNDNGTSLGGCKAGWIKENKTSANTVISANLANIPSFSYTLTAARDGYYDLVMKFSNTSVNADKLAFAVLVDGNRSTVKLSYDKGQHNDSSCNGELHTTVYMTEGDHVISITLALPENTSAAAECNYDSLWTDISSLHVVGGATVAATQKDPTAFEGSGSEDYDTSNMKAVEAETDGYWNRYGNTGAPDYIEAGADPESSPDASGGYAVGSAWNDKNQTIADLKANGLDSSNTAYIGFYVEAPEDGEYYICGRVFINTGSDWSKFTPYGAFVVNGTDVYAGIYTGTDNSYNETEPVKVALKKGINSIAFVPRPEDDNLSCNSGWCNVDCLKIDSALTGVSAATLKLDPTEGTYYQYNDNGTALGGCNVSWIKQYKTAANAVVASNLANIPSFSYTLTAAEDGYHDLVMKARGSVDNMDKLAFAVLVDGELQVVPLSYDRGQIGSTSGSGELHITVHLTAGDHVVSITMLLPENATAAAECNYDGLWTDISSLHAIGGLTVAATQQDPTKVQGSSLTEPDFSKLTYVEAEDTGYTEWFNYSQVLIDPNCHGGKSVGQGDPSNNPTLAELMANPSMDLSGAACFKITVEAPIDDEYYIMPVYSITDNEVDAGSEMDPNPYVVIVVNGKVYTTDNVSKNDWIAAANPVLVDLKAGENEIYIIPMIKDLLDAGYDYANYDCTVLEGRLTAVKKEVVVIDRVEAEDLTYVVWNKYSSKSGYNHNASAGYYIENAWELTNVSYSDLKDGVDLSETAYISFKVIAPADGEYTFSTRYAFRTKAQEASTDFTGDKPYVAFLVNGVAYKSYNTSKNDWIADSTEVSITLKKGENTIYVIPLTADQEAIFAPNGEDRWANIDCVYIDTRLTPVKTGYVEVDNGERNRIEAEDTIYTVWNSYNTTETGGDTISGGLVAAGSHAGNNVYYKELVPGVDLTNTAYLKWTFVAPEAGYYTFGVRFNLKASNLSDGRDLSPQGYATFWVNDSKAYKALLSGNGAKSGWVSDSQDVEIWLEAGKNTVILIPMVRDLYDAYGGGWSNVDCLYFDDALTLEKAPVYTRIDAVNSEYFGYNPEEGRLMREDHTSCYSNKMTFENLTIESINNISWVKYTVFAKSAGTYSIGICFQEGGSLESGKVYTAMSVNGGKFQKVYFLHSEGVHRKQAIYMDIYLQEGENTILITAALAEYITDKDEAMMYIDQECLMLPEGVYGFISDGVPSWTGDDKANIRDSLLSVWGDTSKYVPDDGKNEDDKTGNNGEGNSSEETNPTEATDATDPAGSGTHGSDKSGGSSLVWLWILVLLVIAGGLVFLLVYYKKKKDKEEARA